MRLQLKFETLDVLQLKESRDPKINIKLIKDFFKNYNLTDLQIDTHKFSILVKNFVIIKFCNSIPLDIIYMLKLIHDMKFFSLTI